MTKRNGPTEAQLQAAIEGAKDMTETRPTAPDEATSVDPDEALKRETAVFIPGSHGQKPRA
jgi:hypothetical protein